MALGGYEFLSIVLSMVTIDVVEALPADCAATQFDFADDDAAPLYYKVPHLLDRRDPSGNQTAVSLVSWI